MSSIVNKIKEAVHHDKSSSPHAGTAEGTHGPHSSRAANAVDPRVDSDMDNRAAPGAYGPGPEYSTTDNYTHGTGATSGAGFGTGPAPNTAGPHKSDMLNKADPRIDSDLDGSRNMGAVDRGATAGVTGASGVTQEPYGAAMGTRGTHHAAGAGHHHHHGATAGTTGAGAGFGGAGTSGYGTTAGTTTGFNDPEGTHGPHGSRLMNAADPRVDSDRDHRGTHVTSAVGTGPAPNTAGPHKSDALNKVDPRVDSDLDGSKTMGGNKTFQSNGASTLSKDPTDASQVPPSVMRKHVGDPSIEHDDHLHNRERRNSTATHQETFRGI